VQQHDEREWLGMLVAEGMTMERALVVLNDPWLPEQVRFLNLINSAQTKHRLLITTRIRGLAHSCATCIELAMMAKDEAVALLLDVAGITKHAYQSEHILARCGLRPRQHTTLLPSAGCCRSR
jgi:hypothetical protein